jgi:hypothetical protein
MRLFFLLTNRIKNPQNIFASILPGNNYFKVITKQK